MPDSTHETFFYSPIRVSALSNLSLIIIHISCCKVQKREQIIGLPLCFLAFHLWCRHVRAYILQQIDDSVFWHEKSLSEILLLSNILDRVVFEKRRVLVRDQHDWHDRLIENIFNKWL